MYAYYLMDYIAEVSESDALTTYPIAKRIYSGHTSFCSSVEIAESKTYGRMLFLDGELQSASADEVIYHEALVHPIMSIFTTPSVLVVGGGEGATVREVLKWSPSNVVWVDIDSKLVDMCEAHLQWAPDVRTNPLVRFYGENIGTVLPNLGKFNVIILDLPDPDGDTDYLYSKDFWRSLRQHLTEDGRIVTHTGPVRPFGNIGEGLVRVWKEATAGGVDPWIDGFYSVCIPSFQGEWGFWISGFRPFFDMRMKSLPSGLKVVDHAQMVQWKFPPLRWRTVLADQVQLGRAAGCCNISGNSEA
jgi:spermidine synthase